MSELRTMDPCEHCGKDGPHLVRYVTSPTGAVYVGPLCDACHDAQQRARLAEKERRLLAEWGTLRDRRTA